MKVNTGVYAVLNEVNGKVYIGSTAAGFEKRWKQHTHHSSTCRFLLNALRKYGLENFSFHILEEVDVSSLTKGEAKAKLIGAEQKWLDMVNPFRDNGYNILPKAYSHLGAKRSDATKAALSRAFKGKKHPAWRVEKNRRANLGRVMTAESSEKKRLAILGRISPMKGRTHSEETKAKIRSGGIGKHLGTFSETHRANLSKSLKGRKSSFKGKHHSEEAKEKLRAAKLGKPSPRKGVTLSEETKEKIRAAALRQWQKQKS